jgi:hypothetical protein
MAFVWRVRWNQAAAGRLAGGKERTADVERGVRRGEVERVEHGELRVCADAEREVAHRGLDRT